MQCTLRENRVLRPLKTNLRFLFRNHTQNDSDRPIIVCSKRVHVKTLCPAAAGTIFVSNTGAVITGIVTAIKEAKELVLVQKLCPAAAFKIYVRILTSCIRRFYVRVVFEHNFAAIKNVTTAIKNVIKQLFFNSINLQISQAAHIAA